MPNYRENVARAAGVGGGLIAAADDFLEGNIFSGIVDGTIFGGLSYLAVHALGYFADFIGGGNENNAKKAQANDTIYKNLTA